MNPAIDKIYMVDDFKLGEVRRPREMIASAGGKGLNVARVARLMGESVMGSGLLGGGNGAYIRKKIKELGIVDAFSEIDGETRICINITDTVNQRCSEVLEAGPTIGAQDATCFLETFEGLMEQVRVVTISGSLPTGLPTDFYEKMIRIAKKYGKKVLLDTSGSAFSEGVKACPYLIKPNEDEIEAVYHLAADSEADLVGAILFFKKQGIELPVISRGREGSLAGLSDGIYKITIPPVTVVNTVGSGDSFIAGCAIGLQRGFNEQDMLRMGTACGTANTQFAHTGFVEPEMVERFFKQVQVIKIADY